MTKSNTIVNENFRPSAVPVVSFRMAGKRYGHEWVSERQALTFNRDRFLGFLSLTVPAKWLCLKWSPGWYGQAAVHLQAYLGEYCYRFNRI